MNMLNLVLDTNTLYQPDILKALRNDSRYTMWGSILNILEIVSDINDETSFQKARSQLRLLIECVGRNILLDPDTLFRQYLGFYINLSELQTWLFIIETVLVSQNYSECIQGQYDPLLRGQRKLNVQYAKEFREKYGKLFYEDSVKMIGWINPRSTISNSCWNVQLDDSEIEDMKQLFSFPEFEESLINAFLSRNGLNLSLIKQEDYERARHILSPFKRAYQGHLIKIFRDNIKPEANDYNDLHLTLPLWQNGWVLVSSDRKLREKFVLGGLSPELYSTPKEILNKLHP